MGTLLELWILFILTGHAFIYNIGIMYSLYGLLLAFFVNHNSCNYAFLMHCNINFHDYVSGDLLKPMADYFYSIFGISYSKVNDFVIQFDKFKHIANFLNI